MHIRIAFSGRGYDRARSLPEDLELPDGGTLDDALNRLAELLPDDSPLPAACLIAISGEHAGTVGRHAPRPLVDGDELVLIAPVAGG